MSKVGSKDAMKGGKDLEVFDTLLQLKKEAEAAKMSTPERRTIRVAEIY
jgi:hypothetical protein